jgi:hypothetical protein
MMLRWMVGWMALPGPRGREGRLLDSSAVSPPPLSRVALS